jgi:L,D-transpeptidase YcbB
VARALACALALIAVAATDPPAKRAPAHKQTATKTAKAKAKAKPGAKSAKGKAKSSKTASTTPKPKRLDPAEAARLKPVAVAIGKQASGRVGRFYAARSYWPLWVHGDGVGPEAQAFLKDLDTAARDGLKPGHYDPDKLRKTLDAAKGGDPAKLAAAELALSTALADYVRDVRRTPDEAITYLDPSLEPKKLRPEQVLRVAERAPDFARYVEDMQWMSPLYAQLRTALGSATGYTPEQLRRIRLTLDRLRVLPGPTVKHIVVDAAAAQLRYYDKGVQQGAMRVVAGTAETPTPMLAGVVRYAILNPYWNVPVDLAQKKIAPKVLKGATLKSLRYEAFADWTRDAAKLDPKSIDWKAVAAGSQEVRLRQLPGGLNAMGRVKFMFPNNEGIYLHDTPQKALMQKPDRHFSNGCVRLQDAARLGKWMLGAKFAPEGKAPEQIVPLSDPVPVYLTYLTASPGADGIRFADDVYHRDGER